MRPSHLAALVLAITTATCEPQSTTTPPGPEPAVTPSKPAVPRPKLVVLLVIDQLPSWSFDAQRDALDGGIARMLEHGAYWPRAAYPYATTNTAPGHATIGTGTTPHEHGIVGNRWVDRGLGRMVEVADDPSVPIWDPLTGLAGKRGASSMRLKVDGIADALAATKTGARSVSIALKPRAALLQLGRRPDLAIWFDGGSGAMTTSAGFAEAVPPWLAELARTSTKDPARTQPWTPLDARVAKLSGRPDDAPDEAAPKGMGRVFPHDASKASSPNDALTWTPYATALTIDTAIAAVDQVALGRDDVPDVLAVSFSAHDLAGHLWCQESWERVDHLLRIDRELGRLFEHLDATVGRDAWAAVLTSDHGTIPSRALLKERGQSSTLHVNVDIAKWANEAASTILGPGTWVLGVTTFDVTMTEAFRARSEADRDRALDTVTAELLRRGLAVAVRTDRRASACTGDDVAALVCRSIHPGHSGDIYIAAKQWDIVNDDTGECSVHGSPWAYDREVPIVVMAPGVRSGTRAQQPSMLQVAPTLAALLGVAPPVHAKAAPLPLE
jgi:predicted AlkP superfamily pyrophosphatase or phosphodiesterase